ncbi:hypothetical protein CDD82_6102 [Ophiocordyceps australis]|uniref:Amino acid transporter transmembrane domain-containing protein n=1 Tax=Ophiocordyceps australis TaxID=1399860 RepID=A0A2C5ZSK4_9HYPO|nr:hypothetical protein CDD82_6102 [Ophiocordyceps australis]
MAAEFSETPGSQQSRRQAEILDRFLPEGYSADPEVSLSAGPVEVSPAFDADDPAHINPAYGNSHGHPPGSGPGLVSRSSSGSGTASAISPAVAPVDFENRGDGSSSQGPPVDLVESSLKLQGGDIHRDMFKIKARANSLRRAATFSHQPSPRLHPADELTCPEQREPGGFRRQHLQYRARQRRYSGPLVVARNFVDFLDLYGSFAGEDLEDADTSEDDESAIADDHDDLNDSQQPQERRPLLGRRRSSRRRVTYGDASTFKTFFTLLKAFIGTGIMFLPKAFRNGGILFSSLTLVVISLINCFCFRLLLDCRQKYGGGYGELGAAIVGPRFRSLILASIALSQLGFVCAGLIFTAENLVAFVDAVAKRPVLGGIGVSGFIAIQLVPLVPLALIRNISKLGLVALLADVFILAGLVYIWYYDVHTLLRSGIDPTVRLFNPSDFTLTIGSAIFTFEGIGLILPIQSSMRKPEKFGSLLNFVMFLITIIFTSVGALCYATFGEDTKIQVISNFPQDSILVNAVQLLYSLAVLGGEPVQLFPAVRIIETSLFGERATGKRSLAIKWKKNGIRTAVMALCVVISMIGATDLDKFVALIGSFACVPLVYIYPAYLHYKGAAEKGWAKALDVALMVLGSIAMVYTTLVTVFQWIG